MMERNKRCIYYMPGSISDGGSKHYCSPSDCKTIGEQWEKRKPICEKDCENCKRYKSRFIEYPITVDKLEVKKAEPWNVGLTPVSVKPCDDTKTYFGIYLGEFPRYTGISYNEKERKMTVTPSCNPCIFIPELNKVVFGDESWWKRIEPEEINDIKAITEDMVKGQWYMQMLYSAKYYKEDT